jgi:hypothetical protein
LAFSKCVSFVVFLLMSQKVVFLLHFPLWQPSLRSLGSTLFPCSKCKKNSCILIEVNQIDSIGKFMLLFVKFVGINCLCVLCARLVAEVQIVGNWLRYNHASYFDLDVGHKILIHFVSSGSFISSKRHYPIHLKICLWEHLMCNSFTWIVG